MKNFILGLICIVSPFLSFGHNPLSAKYHLEAGEHASLLTINLSQDGVNFLLSNKLGKEKFKTANFVELEKLIVDYIKSNFNLSVDNQKIVLQEGGIKLGSHQTDLKFVLPPFSGNAEIINIDIPAFQENDNHQTIFSYKVNGKSDYVILSLQNSFQSTIRFSTSTQANHWIWFVLTGLICSILLILYRLSFNKKELNYSIS